MRCLSCWEMHCLSLETSSTETRCLYLKSCRHCSSSETTPSWTTTTRRSRPAYSSGTSSSTARLSYCRPCRSPLQRRAAPHLPTRRSVSCLRCPSPPRPSLLRRRFLSGAISSSRAIRRRRRPAPPSPPIASLRFAARAPRRPSRPFPTASMPPSSPRGATRRIQRRRAPLRPSPIASRPAARRFHRRCRLRRLLHFSMRPASPQPPRISHPSSSATRPPTAPPSPRSAIRQFAVLVERTTGIRPPHRPSSPFPNPSALPPSPRGASRLDWRVPRRPSTPSPGLAAAERQGARTNLPHHRLWQPSCSHALHP
mmetsp:Transcript_9610/g.18139  ORF Transcript_9610/g.18139 Transcript_9610/m.18139 type:complete len:312 (-) Transcript_9610:254-1189(-)